MIRLLIISCLFFILSCEDRKANTPEFRTNAGPQGYALRATCFRIDSMEHYQLLTILSPVGNGAPQRYVLFDEKQDFPVLPDSLLALPRIRIPVRRFALLSTTYLPYFEALGTTDRIVAMAETSWIWGDWRRADLAKRKIPAVGSFPNLDLEKLIASLPELVVVFGTGDPRYDSYSSLIEAKLPVLLTTEWMEATPVGRTEWVRLFGALLGLEKRADSIFAPRLHAYDSIAALVADSVPTRRKVLLGNPQSDTWLIGAGSGFTDRLLADAGGVSLFADDSTGISPATTDFETVLARSVDAALWMHPGIWDSRQEGEAFDPRIKMLAPWQRGDVFQFNKRTSPNGGNDFYQNGMYFCDSLLMDFAATLHPHLFPHYQPIWIQRLP